MTPPKEETARFTLRWPVKLRKLFIQYAVEKGTSVNKEILLLLEEAAAWREARKQKEGSRIF